MQTGLRTGSTRPAARATATGRAGNTATGRNSAGKISGTSNDEKAYIAKHFAYIRDIIMKNLCYPLMARKMGWQGKVIVSFIINENGGVEDIKIIKSSGFDMLDRGAIKTIRKVCPFPKPPARAELRVPIVYRLE